LNDFEKIYQRNRATLELTRIRISRLAKDVCSRLVIGREILK
jgi:hypothetical protein